MVRKPSYEELEQKVKEMKAGVLSHKQKAEALPDGESIYKTFMENVQDGVFTVDKEGRFTFVNEVIINRSGQPIDWFLGKHFWDVIRVENRDRIKKLFDTVMNEEKAIIYELAYPTVSGDDLWVEVNVKSMWENGRIIGLFGISRDITDKKRAEEALRENEERYRDIASNIPGVIYQFVLKKDGSYSSPYMSEGASSVLDISGKEVVANPYSIFDRILQEDLDSVNQSIAESARTMKTWLQEFRIRTTTGDIKWIRGTSTPHPLPDGEILWNGVLLDISDRVKAEEELQKAHDELERRVEERTAELLKFNEKLKQEIEERKKTQEALRESEEKYRTSHAHLTALLKNTDDYILISDRKGFPVMFNSVYARLMKEALGIDMKPGLQPHKSLPDKEAVVWWDNLHQRVLDGEIFREEYKHEFSKGEVRHFEISYHPIIENNEVTGFSELTRDITERKKAEEALRESEERHRLVVENANEAIVVTQKGLPKFFNPKAVEISGYSEEEYSKRYIADHLHPDDRKWVSDTHERRMTEESVPETYEFRIKTKDGQTKWLYVNVVTVNWENQPASLNFFTDITERKKAEEALRESEEKYRTILESIEESYYEVDIEGNFTFFNDAMCKILGYPKDELIGMNYRQYSDEEMTKKAYQVFNKVYNTGKPDKGFDREFIRKDGTTRSVEFSVSLVKDSEGQPIGFRGIVRDVSERKQAEEALRESEERYRALFEQAADSIILTDPDTGTILEFNDSAYKNLGYTREEFQELSMPNFEVNESPEEFQKHIEKINKKGSHVFKTKHRRKSGEIRDILINSKFISIHQSKFIQSIGTDVTELKRTEQELKKREQALEDKTSNLAEANIALKMLLNSRDKDKLEIEEKVLFNVKELIIPYLEKLKNCNLDERQKTYADILETNLNDIISPFSRRMTSMFLSFTPMEIQVANLVKHGKTTQDIANLFNLSPRTIETHRDNIRKKIGIKKKKANLRSHLLSIQ